MEVIINNKTLEWNETNEFDKQNEDFKTAIYNYTAENKADKTTPGDIFPERKKEFVWNFENFKIIKTPDYIDKYKNRNRIWNNKIEIKTY